MLPPDNLLLGVACSVERTDSTAPSVDDVDAVTALDALARVIIDHNRRVLSGEPVDWAVLTDLIGNAERACRRLRPPDLRDGRGSQLTVSDRE